MKKMYIVPPSIRVGKPIISSLHEMRTFTRGCHYNNEECTRFTDRCGQCHVLGSTQKRDLSRWIWKRKRRTYDRVRSLTIIGLSRWLADEARRSSLFSDRPVVNLPNPIDTDVFRPIERSVVRQMWGLDPDARVVLFGAMSATTDFNKGYDLLLSALKAMHDDCLQLCVFGASTGPDTIGGLPVRYVGQLSDDVSLATLYGAADVMVVPSRQEAFGQTATEAMACGTPVVAFGVTGLLDIIDHQENGYLARPYQPDDLATGIQWVLDQGDRGRSLRAAAREKVVACFGYGVVAEGYGALYRSIVIRETDHV